MTLPASIVANPRVDWPHHKIHEGSFTSIDQTNILLTKKPKYFLILTPRILPDGTVLQIHTISTVTVNPGARYEIFEDATVSNRGTPITPRSNNRPRATDPSGFSFEDPTVVSEGTKIWEQIIGSTTTGGKGGNNHRDEEEFMLKFGSQYLFKISPLADGVTILSFRINNYSNRFTPFVPPPPIMSQ